MKVLVISYHYPPDPAVGSVRPARMVEALRGAGHDVTVLTAQVHGVNADPDEAGAIRVRPWPGFRDLYRSLRARFSRGNNVERGVEAYFGTGRYALPERFPVWKRFLLSLMWLPDDLHGFIPPAFLRARRFARKGERPVVITSAPPFSVHMVGVFLSMFTRVRWIVDFRDPWMAGYQKPPHVRTRFSDAVESWAQRRCLTHAAAVLTNSTGIARQLEGARHNAARNGAPPVVVIRNGIEDLAARPASWIRPVRRITYLGYLYLNRDPRPFLDAIAALWRSGRIDLAECHVDFYGACRWYNSISVEDYVTQLGLTDHVRFFDPIEREQCRAVLAASDLLLLLAQRQPMQIPNKLYDYLSVRRPILAFADDEGDTAGMLRELGGHYIVASDDPAAIAETVRAAINGEAPSRLPDDAVLEEWSAGQQMHRFVGLVERIATGDR